MSSWDYYQKKKKKTPSLWGITASESEKQYAEEMSNRETCTM